MKIYLSLVILLVFGCSSSKVAVVVDMNALFDGFEYTKELTSEYTQKTQMKRMVLDSMLNSIKAFEGVMDASKDEDKLTYENAVLRYQTELRNFNQYNDKLTVDSDSKILTQLKSYLSDFGKENGYDFILTYTDTDLTVIYRKDILDVTDEALTFINAKYDGKN